MPCHSMANFAVKSVGSSAAAAAFAACAATARTPTASQTTVPLTARPSNRCECTELLHHGLIERLAIDPRAPVSKDEALLRNPADDFRIDDVLAVVHALGKGLLGIAWQNRNP